MDAVLKLQLLIFAGKETFSQGPVIKVAGDPEAVVIGTGRILPGSPKQVVVCVDGRHQKVFARLLFSSLVIPEPF